jgi:hypothetical protein
MSFKPQVFVDGEWGMNNLVFATKEEAEISARDLFNRWFLCTDHRAFECDEVVNYKITADNQMVPC